jgi:hypothetical protein
LRVLTHAVFFAAPSIRNRANRARRPARANVREIIAVFYAARATGRLSEVHRNRVFQPLTQHASTGEARVARSHMALLDHGHLEGWRAS